MSLGRKSVIVNGIVFMFLGACATTGQSPTFFPPAGSEVIVNQELNARSGTRVFIQDGQVLERRDVGVVNPYCQFVLWRSREEMKDPIVIQPATFTITRTFRQKDYSWADGQLLAEFRSNATMTTFMELSSDTQPEVRQLLCMRWGSPRLDRFLTIDEMKATLSPIVELRLLSN